MSCTPSKKSHRAVPLYTHTITDTAALISPGTLLCSYSSRMSTFSFRIVNLAVFAPSPYCNTNHQCHSYNTPGKPYRKAVVSSLFLPSTQRKRPPHRARVKNRHRQRQRQHHTSRTRTQYESGGEERPMTNSTETKEEEGKGQTESRHIKQDEL